MRHIAQGCPSFGGNERAYVNDCLETGWLTSGHWVERFEKTFADYIGVKHAVATKSGTAALHLSLAALGIGPGDEVIVPALTFVATANAVSYTGAKPVIADVDPDTWLMDWKYAGGADAYLPVSLFGVPTETSPTVVGHPVIDDACEALGARVGSMKTGQLGRAACFSFYGNKTITTGEGGMVTTNDNALAARMRHMRSECTDKEKRFYHDGIGFNYVMTDIQGALGCAQMEALRGILEWRAEVAAQYRKRLGGAVTFQRTPDGCTHGNWAMGVLMPEGVDREVVRAQLKEGGIETRPFFYPLNTLPMYKGPSCPVAESVAARGILLPMHAELNPDDVDYVCDELLKVLEHEASRASLNVA